MRRRMVLMANVLEDVVRHGLDHVEADVVGELERTHRMAAPDFMAWSMLSLVPAPRSSMRIASSM